MLLLAVADESQRGWGGPIAILTAFAIIGVIHLIHERQIPPSPDQPRPRLRGVNRQVSTVPGTDDTAAEGWWGRITTIDGARQRIYQEDPDVLADDALDLALDDSEPEPNNLEEWVYENLHRMGYSELVRDGMRLWAVSERTVKRRIAEARQQTG